MRHRRVRPGRGIALAAITLTILALGAAPATGSPAGERVHIVQPGEHLVDIAQRYGYDQPGDWRLIAALGEGMVNPHALRVGQRVTVPSSLAMRRARRAPDMALQPAIDEDASETVPRHLWERLAGCESSGDWTAATGNGFYGGLQFTPESWRLVGGEGLPHRASPDRQIELAGRLLELQGWDAWPVCARLLGLR